MNYRRLGKTGLMVSEIGYGGEWLDRMSAEEARAITLRAAELGVNIVDCWVWEMPGRRIRATRLCRDISAQPGRVASTCARATSRPARWPLMTCSPASTLTMWSWA